MNLYTGEYASIGAAFRNSSTKTQNADPAQAMKSRYYLRNFYCFNKH